jgi:hypothetical protein
MPVVRIEVDRRPVVSHNEINRFERRRVIR